MVRKPDYRWFAIFLIDELCKSIYESAHLKGTFKLRSEQISNEYFDKYLFESKPLIFKEFAKQMAKLIPENTEILAGLEMGGIPVVFVRKKAKEYGTCKFRSIP